MATILNILSSKQKGGLEEVFVHYLRAQLAYGHKVVALVRPGAAMIPHITALGGVQLVYSRLLTCANPVARVRAYLLHRSLRPDLVVVHNRRLFGLFPNMLAVNHGASLCKRRCAKAVIAINSSLARQMQEAGMPHVRVLHNPILHIPPLVDFTPRSVPVIGFMGRFTKEKGLGGLLDALAQITTPCKLLIAGSGPMEAALKAKVCHLGIEQKVEFLGWVNNGAEFYAKIDVLCVPSMHEGFGMVILEAMAHGVPVIATDCDGPRDIIRHGENGMLVPVADGEALANGIGELLANPSLRQELRACAHAELGARFGFEQFSQRLEAIIQENL